MYNKCKYKMQNEEVNKYPNELWKQEGNQSRIKNL